MALERVGLGGVLTFDGTQAVRGTGQARDAFDRLARTVTPLPSLMTRISSAAAQTAQRMMSSAQSIGRGVTSLAGAAQRAGMAMMPLTAAVGVGVHQAVSFETQMDGVNAILTASEADLSRLTNEARRMGIISVFSATQAGEAMELMARSGANVDEIMGGLQGVMQAAAAESIDLASATDVVAQTTRILGRSWDQAANTADILVRTSQRTNTNVLALGESIRYGGQQAHAAGLDLEQTAAILGVFADAGQRGSVGGTAMTNALIKMANPTARARQLMQQYNIQLYENADGSVDFIRTMEGVGDAMSRIHSRMDRVNITTELFGIRGARAEAAIEAAGRGRTSALVEQMRRASDGIGASAEAASRRLSNVHGRMILLLSSMEGVAITLFTPILGPLAEAILATSNYLNNILTAVNAIYTAGDDVEARYNALTTALTIGGGEIVTSVALGAVDAIHDLVNAFNAARTAINNFMSSISGGLGPDVFRWLTRVGILMTLMAAAMGPVLIAVGSLVLLIASIGTGVIEGVGAILGAVFVPLLIAVGILVGLFFAIRREGETTGQTLARIWSVVREAALRVWYEGIMPFYEGFRSTFLPIFEELRVIWGEVTTTMRTTLGSLAAQFQSFGGKSTISWRQLGQAAAMVIGAILRGILWFANTVIPIWGAVMGFLIRYVGGTVTNIQNMFHRFVSTSQAVGSAMAQIWLAVSHWFKTTFGDTISTVVGYFNLFRDMVTMVVDVVGNWIEMAFKRVQSVVASVVSTIMEYWNAGMGYVQMFTSNVMSAILYYFNPVLEFIGRIREAMTSLWNSSVISGLRTIGQAILDLLLEPIKAVIRGVVNLVDALGGDNMIDQRIRSWAEAATPAIRTPGAGGGRGPNSDLTDALFGNGQVQTRHAQAARPSAARQEQQRLGRQVAERAAAARRRGNAPGNVTADVTLDQNQQIDVNNEVCVDGRNLNVASQRHQTEIGERSGFRTTPWQRRQRAEHGAAPRTGA